MTTNIQPTPEYWHTNFVDEKTFAVPIGSSNEVVEINLNDLPETEEILDVLKGERPPVRTWNIIALHYLVRKKDDSFCAILENARLFANKDHQQTAVDEAFCMDLLANYYALESSKERDRERKKDFVTKATLLYNQVDKLLVYNQYHLVGRAYFCLFDPEKIEQAKTQFDFVLRSAPTDPLALQGRGIVAFHKQDFRQALSYFKKLLSSHPGCSADVRMAIGHCLFKLNRHEKAKIAYERARQLDHQCVGAMVGLALILLNEGTTVSVHAAMQHIVKVYSIDKTNPINLNLLADHFFYRKEPEKAINLSQVAIQTSHSDMLKAESAYMLGRGYHYKEDYDQAFQYYYQATQFAKHSFVLPWYGLGQMYIQRKEYANATQCFEKVLAGSPNNIETLRILGLMYLTTSAKDDKKALAKSYLKKVTEMRPDDIDAHMKFAELQEVSDPKSALNTYLRVVEIYRERSAKDEAPPELLNNISVLYFYLGDIVKSQKYLEMAKKRAEEARMRDPDNHYGACLVTMTYNEGRLAEEARDFEEAQKCYKNIVYAHNNYVDCYLRYGCISRDRGNILEASDWFKEAGSVNPDHPDSHLLLGNLHMSKGEYGPAQKKYEKVLSNPKTKSDTYAQLGLANIWLETLYGSNLEPDKRKRHQERAFLMYRQVQKIDPSNVYAVNGMGAILAKRGQWEEAKEMFSVVRESTADILDLWLNIGHLYCDTKQYLAGMKMYENALKRFSDAALDPQVFLYLARAQYLHGDFGEARKTLQLARRLSPQNQVLRYNLGIVMKRMAVTTLKDSRANLQDVMGAIEDLKAAQMIFQFLSTEGDKASVDQSRAGNEGRMCSDYLNQTTYHLDRAKEADIAQKIMLEKVEEARIAYQKRLQEETLKLTEEKFKHQEELIRKRQEAIQRTTEVKEKIIRSHAEVDTKPARRRPKKDKGLQDEFINDEGYDREEVGPNGERRRIDDAERRRMKAARRKRREQKRGGASGGAVSSDEENGKLAKPVDEYAGPRGKRYLSKAYISDTDSTSASGSDDEGASKPKKSAAVVDSDSDIGGDMPTGGGIASSDEEGGAMKTKKRKLSPSDEDVEKPEKTKAAKRALASSDEDDTPAGDGEVKDEPEETKGTKRPLGTSDEDMPIESEEEEKTEKTKGGKLALAYSDEDIPADADLKEEVASDAEGSPTRAKLSLNDSGSE